MRLTGSSPWTQPQLLQKPKPSRAGWAAGRDLPAGIAVRSFCHTPNAQVLPNYWVLEKGVTAAVSVARVRCSATPRAAAHQAPLSVELSRQEYWRALPFPPPGALPDPGTEPGSPALRADSLPSEPPGKPWKGSLHTRTRRGRDSVTENAVKETVAHSPDGLPWARHPSAWEFQESPEEGEALASQRVRESGRQTLTRAPGKPQGETGVMRQRGERQTFQGR